MTENKRFVETVSTGIVTDNMTNKEYNCEMRIDDDFLNLVNTIEDENEQLKQKIKEIQKEKEINCNNCQYFVSDCVSSDCLKREDIGYKGTCIDGMNLHLLALGCPYYD